MILRAPKPDIFIKDGIAHHVIYTERLKIIEIKYTQSTYNILINNNLIPQFCADTIKDETLFQYIIANSRIGLVANDLEIYAIDPFYSHTKILKRITHSMCNSGVYYLDGLIYCRQCNDFMELPISP